jgi:hypothetical protein
VHPEHRARGIGSAMQAALFDALRGQAELVSVFREEPQSPAYRWYIANGFRPAMHIDSWFYERDSSGGGNILTFEIFDPADPGVPWDLIEQIWQITGRSGGGFVDRAQRPLAAWLAVHPYRRRYKFTLLLDRAAPGYALCGVGSMHSSSPRLDILELCSTGDANATALLLDGVLKCARNMNRASTRWPLAAQDPHVHLAQNAGFARKWGFDMLVHPLAGEFDFSPEPTADWRYAGVDYI